MRKSRAIESQHGAELSRVGRNDDREETFRGEGRVGIDKNNGTPSTIDRRPHNIIEGFTSCPSSNSAEEEARAAEISVNQRRYFFRSRLSFGILSSSFWNSSACLFSSPLLSVQV